MHTILLLCGLILSSAIMPDKPQRSPAPTTSPTASWQKLYADEPWYRDFEGQERIFSGTLERVPRRDGASILMRSFRYRLDSRFIYPDRENAAMERLVGQKVEIRGKAYDHELEGVSLKEIWPAAIRALDAPATRPAKPTSIGFDVHDGYFVSNKFEPDAPASFVVITNQQQFDRVFGVAMVMGDRSHRLPQGAFQSKIVLAAIKRGKALWTYKVQDVTESAAVLTLRYAAEAQPQATAEFACPLIVSVPKADYLAVIFEENGKVVRKVGDSEPASSDWSIELRKKDDRASVVLSNGRMIVDIFSPSGIGSATMSRHGDAWPANVTIRLHLTGLEFFAISNDRARISASSDAKMNRQHIWKANQEGPRLDNASPYWMTIRAFDAEGRPAGRVPIKGGVFEITVPNAVLEDAASIKLEWIDFYRA